MSTIYIEGGYDVDSTVEWAIDNCPSFDKYRIVELTWEEKVQRDCWFRLEIYFKEPADQTLFELRWIR